jgi:phage terminase small subunit
MKASEEGELTAKEYLVDVNGKQAAIRAGYSPRRAEVTAAELLANRKVSEAVADGQKKRADEVGITARAVLSDLWTIARADPRQIVEFRRQCCRYCWGKDNRYQRTASEMERDHQDFDKRNTELIEAGKPGLGAFDEKGGIGFSPKKDPNENCPECFGDGVGETFVHDTRKLSPAAARLFAGIKQTREGIDVKMLSQDDALVNVGRHMGLFKDKIAIGGDETAPPFRIDSVPLAGLSNEELTTLKRLLAKGKTVLEADGA